MRAPVIPWLKEQRQERTSLLPEYLELLQRRLYIWLPKFTCWLSYCCSFYTTRADLGAEGCSSEISWPKIFIVDIRLNLFFTSRYYVLNFFNTTQKHNNSVVRGFKTFERSLVQFSPPLYTSIVTEKIYFQLNTCGVKSNHCDYKLNVIENEKYQSKIKLKNFLV